LYHIQEILMQIVSQLSIFLENKPGIFARVCSEFAKEGINMLAIMVEDAVDHAVVRLVADDNKKSLRNTRTPRRRCHRK